jgi:hypothetical protein
MTVIDSATQIPSQINTLERLAMWACMSLRRVNPTLSIIEVANEAAEKAVQTAIIQADDGSIRFVGRVSIELTPDYAEDNTTKLWTKALELSNVVLPNGFTSD